MEKEWKTWEIELMKKRKDYLKCALKPSYISHKIFDNHLLAISKSKALLKLSKPAYSGMCFWNSVKY